MERTLGVHDSCHSTAMECDACDTRRWRETFFTFTVTRHPLSRLVSLFHHTLTHPQDFLWARGLSFDLFVEALSQRANAPINGSLPGFFKSMASFLVDNDGYLHVQALLSTESLERDWGQLQRIRQRSRHTLPNLQTPSRTSKFYLANASSNFDDAGWSATVARNSGVGGATTANSGIIGKTSNGGGGAGKANGANNKVELPVREWCEFYQSESTWRRALELYKEDVDMLCTRKKWLRTSLYYGKGGAAASRGGTAAGGAAASSAATTVESEPQQQQPKPTTAPVPQPVPQPPAAKEPPQNGEPKSAEPKPPAVKSCRVGKIEDRAACLDAKIRRHNKERGELQEQYTKLKQELNKQKRQG